MTASEIAYLIATVLGGLGLFIYGMKVMTTGLQSLAGSRLRELLNRLTRHRVPGLGVGTAIGFLVHSSAGTVMLVGFINAGLLSLYASIPVMLGNNLGTTLSMQMFSFKLSKYCYHAIALGLGVNLASSREALKNTGLLLFGFGLLFLGMKTMSGAIVPLKEAGYFEGFLAHTDGSTFLGMLLGIGASSLVTGIIQSSGATIGMLFALATAGVFTDLTAAFPLILGAHIGTCATALLGSLGTILDARRAALSHLVFNLGGALLAAAMAPLYLWLIPTIGGDMVRQIANTHTAVQLFNSLLILPFVGLFAHMIVRMTPSRKPPEEASHLDERYLVTPEMAIVAVLQESRRMANIARKMVRRAMHGLITMDDKDLAEVVRQEESVNLLKEAANAYLMQISRRQLSRRQAVMVQYLMRSVADIERIGDHADTLAEITREKTERRVWFDDESMMRLIELYQKADDIMGLTVASLNPAHEEFESCATQIIEVRREYKRLSRDCRDRFTQRVLAKQDDALNGIYYSRYIDAFDRILNHTRSVARLERDPLFRVKPHKLDEKRATAPPKPVPKGKGIRVDTAMFHTDGLDLYDDEEPKGAAPRKDDE